jgi:modulator of FtsH protease HflK
MSRTLSPRWWQRAAQRLLSNGRQDGPPDLDELYRDFKRKFAGLFGGKGVPRSSGGGDTPPDLKGASSCRKASKG